LLGVAAQIAARAAKWIEEDTRIIRGLRLQRVEILPVSAVREGLRLGVFVGLWLTRLGLVYTWVLAVLSLFPATRPLAGRATGFLFAPAVELLARLATRLPLFIAVLLALLMVLLVVRFISLYARGIERREIASKWARPETARTTGRLLSVGLGLGSLLFITPLLSGASDGPLPRLGFLGFLAVALGATPIVTSCLLGMRMVYGRLWRLGDSAEYGGERGVLESVGLFDVRLRGTDGSVVRVPHLMSLWRPTRIYSTETPDLAPPSRDWQP
jgi:small-conductance mechanosensitive channel